MQSDKMAALALLPGGEGQGKDAARELQRCVVKLKFVGGIVAVGRAGEGILDAGFEEVWGTAVKFGVPIVVRGVWPTDSEVSCELQSERGR
jgi:predicted TIM-barrel fold metal-dependent hydrolase